MNVKKYLREQAEKDAKNLITERDEEFINSYIESVPTEKPCRVKVITLNTKQLVAIVLAAVLLVSAAIILPIVFRDKGIEDITYKAEDTVERSSTFEELATDVKYFNILETQEVTLYYDSVSGDKLYYTAKYVTALYDLNVNIIVNKNFDLTIDLGDNLLKQNLDSYELSYNFSKSSELNAYEIRYFGLIELNSEKVYIEYNQIIDVGEGVFFEDIQNVLKVKN